MGNPIKIPLGPSKSSDNSPMLIPLVTQGFNGSVMPNGARPISPSENLYKTGEFSDLKPYGADYGLMSGFNQQDFRNENQSNLDIVGNSIAHFAGTAISAGLEIPALVWGVVKAPFVGWASLPENIREHGFLKGAWESEVQAFNQYYDNELSRQVVDPINDWFQNTFPVYQSRAQSAAPFFSIENLASGHTLDMIASGAGYTVGSLLTGAGLTKIFGLAKEAAAGAKIASQTDLLEAGSKAASRIMPLETRKQLYIGTLMAGMEASQQARSDKDENIKLLRDNHPELTEEQIQNIADKRSLFDFAVNMAILAPTDAMLLRNWWRPNAKSWLASGETNVSKTLGEVSLKETSSQIGKALSTTGKILKRPFKSFIFEGGQEALQYASQKGLEDYSDRRLNDPDGNAYLQSLYSLGVGLADALLTKEGAENWYTGGVIGLSGAGPSTIQELIQAKTNKDFSKKQLSWFNSQLPQQNLILKARLLDANRTLSFAKSAENNLLNRDEFNYYNDLHSAFVSMVQQNISNGTIELLKARIKSLHGVPQEEVNTTFGNQVTQEHLIAWNTAETLENLIQEIDDVVRTDVQIKRLAPNPYDPKKDKENFLAFQELQNTFTYLASSIHNSDKRIQKLNAKLAEMRAVPFDVDLYIGLSKEEREGLDKEILEINEKNLSPENFKEAKQYYDDIKDLKTRREIFKRSYEILQNDAIKRGDLLKKNKEQLKEVKLTPEEFKPEQKEKPEVIPAPPVVTSHEVNPVVTETKTEKPPIETSGVGETLIQKGEREELTAGVHHFGQLFKYKLADALKKKGESLKNGTPLVLTKAESFALSFDDLLQKTLSQPGGIDKVQLKIVKARNSGFQGALNLKPKELGFKTPDIIAILSVDGQDGFQVQFPYFYTLNGKSIDFRTLSFDEFNKYFSKIGGENFRKDEYSLLQKNWQNLKEFHDQLVRWYNDGNENTPLPKYAITKFLTAQIDFGNRVPLESIKGSIFENSPIVDKDGNILNGKEVPDGFPRKRFDLPGPHYYILAIHPNGFKGEDTWIELTPRSKSSTTVIQDLRTAKERIDKLDSTKDNTQELLSISNDINLFISIDQEGTAEKTLFIGTHSFEGIPKLTMISRLGNGAFHRKEITEEDLLSIDNLITKLNSNEDNIRVKSPYNFKVNLIKRELGEDGKPVSQPKEAGIKDFEIDVTPHVFKNWSLRFGFNPRFLQLKPKEEVKTEPTDIEAKKADIEKEVLLTEEISEVKSKPGIQKIPEALQKQIDEVNQSDLTPEEKEEEIKDRTKAYWDTVNSKSEEENEEGGIIKGKIYFNENQIGTSAWTYEDAVQYAKQYTPEDTHFQNTLDGVFRNLRTSGIPVGAYTNGCIYMRDGIGKSDLDHEVFHSVFDVLEDKQKERYLNAKKAELKYTPQQLQDRKNHILETREDIRELYSTGRLSERELEDLVYEEHLSDEYSDYKADKLQNPKSWKDILFRLLDKIINFFTGRPDIIGLFEQIDRGAFTNSKYKIADKSNSLIKTKLLGAKGAVESQSIVSTVSSRLLDMDSRNPMRKFDDLMKELIQENNTLTKGNRELLKSSPNPEALRKYLNESRALYEIPETREVLKDEVKKYLKVLGFSKKNLDEESFDEGEIEDEDKEEKEFNKDSSEYNPAENVSVIIKNWIRGTLYKVNYYGKEVDTAVNFQRVFEVLLNSLVGNVSREEIIPTLENLAPYNPEVKAIFDRLVTEKHWSKETPDGINSLDRNFLNLFKNQFYNLTRVEFVNSTIIIDRKAKTQNIQQRVTNKRDNGRNVFNSWSNIFSIKREKGVLDSANREYNSKVLAPLREILDKWNKGEDVKADLKSILPNIGITFDDKYLDAIFDPNFNSKGFTMFNKDILKRIIDTLSKDVFNNNIFQNNYQLKKILLNVAESNARLTPDYVQKISRSVDNKPRNSYIQKNLYFLRRDEINTIWGDEANIKNIQPESWLSYNSWLNKDPRLCARDNSRAKIALMGDITLNKRISTYKNMTDDQFLAMYYGSYADSVDLFNDGNKYIRIIPSIISDKRRLYSMYAPLRGYATGENFTSLAEKDLKDMFIQEYKTLKGEFGEINPDLNFWVNFPEMNDHPDIIERIDKNGLHSEWENVYSIIKQAILDKAFQYQEILSKEANLFVKSQDLVNFVLNDLIQSESINQLVQGKIRDLKPKFKGNETWQEKLDILNAEWTKRQSGVSGDGPDMGEGNDRVQYMTGTRTYSNIKSNNIIPEEEYEQLSKEERKEYKEIDANDSQGVYTPRSILRDKLAQGTLFDYQDGDKTYSEEELWKKLNGDVFDEEGNPVPLTEKEKGLLDAIAQKHSIRGEDTEARQMYDKMTLMMLDPWTFGKWVKAKGDVPGHWEPKPLRELGFYQWKHMNDANLDMLIPLSAHKMYLNKNHILDSSKFRTGEIQDFGAKKVFEIPRKYRRETASISTKSTSVATYSTQQQTLVSYGLSDTEDNDLKRREYKEILTNLRKAFITPIMNQWMDEGGKLKEDIEYPVQRMRESTEETNPNRQTSEIMSTVDGKLKYRFDLPHVTRLIESKYLADFRPGYKLQINGANPVVSSSIYFPVLRNLETGEVVPNSEINKNMLKSPRYKRDVLQQMYSNNKPYSEIILSKETMGRLKLRVGDFVIMNRTPLQDYGFMAVAKIVDELPEYYGDSIISSSGMIDTSGQDHDGDKLFIYAKDRNSRGRLYGESTTDAEKFEEYRDWLVRNNPDVRNKINEKLDKSEYSELKDLIDKHYEFLKKQPGYQTNRASDRVIDDIFGEYNLLDKLKMEASILKTALSRETLQFFELPGTLEEYLSAGSPKSTGELINNLIDSVTKILQTPELKRFYQLESGTKLLENTIQKYEMILGTSKVVRYINGLDGKLKGRQDNIAATILRGVSVLGLTGSAQLAEYKATLTPEFIIRVDGVELKSFGHTSSYQAFIRLKNLSSNIHSILDNAKLPQAGRLGWDSKKLGAMSVLLALDPRTEDKEIINFNVGLLMQPGVREIKHQFTPEDVLRRYKKDYENAIQDLQNKGISLEKMLKLRESENTELSTKELEDSIISFSEGNKGTDNYIKYLITQIKALEVMDKAYKIAQYKRNVDDLITMFRWYGRNFTDAENRFLQAYDNLINTEDNDELPFNISTQLINDSNIGNLVQNLKRILNTASELWIKQTPYYHEVMGELLGNLNLSFQQRSDIEPKIREEFISYLMMQMLKTSNPGIDYNSSIIKKEGVPTTLEKFTELFAQDEEGNYKYPQFVYNSLVKFLQGMKPYTPGNPNPIPVLGFDTNTKYSREMNELFTDSILQLIKAKDSEGHIIPEVKDFAKNELWKYLIAKSNLLFGNNDFVGILPTFMYSEVSRLMNKLNQELLNERPNDAVIQKLLGKSLKQAKNEFIENFIRNTDNIQTFKKVGLKSNDTINGKPVWNVQQGDNSFKVSLNPDVKSKRDLGNSLLFKVKRVKGKMQVLYPNYIAKYMGDYPDFDSYGNIIEQSVYALYIKTNHEGNTAEYSKAEQYTLKAMRGNLNSPRENIEISKKLKEVKREETYIPDEFDEFPDLDIPEITNENPENEKLPENPFPMSAEEFNDASDFIGVQESDLTDEDFGFVENVEKKENPVKVQNISISNLIESIKEMSKQLNEKVNPNLESLSEDELTEEYMKLCKSLGK